MSLSPRGRGDCSPEQCPSVLNVQKLQEGGVYIFVFVSEQRQGISSIPMQGPPRITVAIETLQQPILRDSDAIYTGYLASLYLSIACQRHFILKVINTVTHPNIFQCHDCTRGLRMIELLKQRLLKQSLFIKASNFFSDTCLPKWRNSCFMDSGCIW